LTALIPAGNSDDLTRGATGAFAIQPCGVLAVLDSDLRTLLRVSANIDRFFGVAAAEALGRDPVSVFGSRLSGKLRSELGTKPRLDGPISVQRTIDGRRRRLQVKAWRSGGYVVVEVEPLFALGSRRLLGSVNQWLADLARASHPDDLLATLVESIADISGFERVMVCHFEDHGNGVVIAENQADGQASMHGQRFPSAVFPPEQRARFVNSPLRSVPDLTADDVPLVPDQWPQGPDLSTSVLAAPNGLKRNLSEYLGARALLTVSVMSETGLWGMVVCTHSRPHALSPTVRDATYTLVQMAGQRLFLLKARIEAAFLGWVQQFRERLAGDMAGQRTPAQRLRESGDEWQSLFRAHGITLVARGHISSVGTTPGDAVIASLTRRLESRPGRAHFLSECLHDDPLCHGLSLGPSCGLMAVALPATGHTPGWLMLFRPRHRGSVYWAGNPMTPVISGQEARAAALKQPLELWQQETRYQSEPWDRIEKQGAEDLAEDLAVLSSAREVAELNQQLEEERQALARANSRLEQMATRDSLTGLSNRYAMEQALDDALARAERYGESFSVVLVDVDHFKQVNDTYGHDTGDRVLRAVAGAMANSLRETDRIGRWGGEEFVVIVCHSQAGDAAGLAERLRSGLETLEVPGFSGSVTASFGLAGWQPGDRRKTVVARADGAMYQAKKDGRNRVVLAGDA
jgi:diguanylate cyclase (GGDEF)-like protein